MLAVITALGLAACGAPTLTEKPSPQASEPKPVETPEPVVTFTDEALEELVRKALNKPESDITIAEAESVTKLDLQMDANS